MGLVITAVVPRPKLEAEGGALGAVDVLRQSQRRSACLQGPLFQCRNRRLWRACKDLAGVRPTHLFYRTAKPQEGPAMAFCKKGIRISPMQAWLP